MAAVRHLGFSKFGNFNCPYPSGGENASSCQILCRSVKALRRYGRFRFFKMRPSAILDFQKWEILTARTLGTMTHFGPQSLWGPKCVIIPNFVLIGRTVAEIWLFLIFQDAAVRHLGFLKVRNFNCPYPSGGQNASSCQILCRSVKALRRYGRFRFFKMAAVRHLGFVIRLFGPPTKCILVVSVTVQNLV